MGIPVKKLTITVFAVLAVVIAGAQTDNNGRLSWWLAYYLRHSLNRRWTVAADVQVRNFAKEPVLGLLAIRNGVHYRINGHWSVAIGGAWFHQRQITPAKKMITTDEVRLWEEIRHEVKLKSWQITNQVRTEQRYWIKSEELAFRFRYRLSADYSIDNKWKLMAGNEIMWQTSRVRSNWDQYRLWLGGEYSINRKNQVQLIFMNWWQTNTKTYQPVIRINFSQAINSVI